MEFLHFYGLKIIEFSYIFVEGCREGEEGRQGKGAFMHLGMLSNQIHF